jgi:hypothetical protein
VPLDRIYPLIGSQYFDVAGKLLSNCGRQARSANLGFNCRGTIKHVHPSQSAGHSEVLFDQPAGA